MSNLDPTNIQRPDAAPGMQPGFDDYSNQGGGSGGIILTGPMARVKPSAGSADAISLANGACSVIQGSDISLYCNFSVDRGTLTVLSGPITGASAATAPTITIYNAATQAAVSGFSGIAATYYDASALTVVEVDLLMDTSNSAFVANTQYVVEFTCWLQCSADSSIRRQIQTVVLDIMPIAG